jgi:hypothetical protein
MVLMLYVRLKYLEFQVAPWPPRIGSTFVWHFWLGTVSWSTDIPLPDILYTRVFKKAAPTRVHAWHIRRHCNITFPHSHMFKHATSWLQGIFSGVGNTGVKCLQSGNNSLILHVAIVCKWLPAGSSLTSLKKWKSLGTISGCVVPALVNIVTCCDQIRLKHPSVCSAQW